MREDEHAESVKRQRMLDAKVEELRRSHPLLTRGKVIISTIFDDDSFVIYCYREILLYYGFLKFSCGFSSRMQVVFMVVLFLL